MTGMELSGAIALNMLPDITAMLLGDTGPITGFISRVFFGVNPEARVPGAYFERKFEALVSGRGTAFGDLRNTPLSTERGIIDLDPDAPIPTFFQGSTIEQHANTFFGTLSDLVELEARPFGVDPNLLAAFQPIINAAEQIGGLRDIDAQLSIEDRIRRRGSSNVEFSGQSEAQTTSTIEGDIAQFDFLQNVLAPMIIDFLASPIAQSAVGHNALFVQGMEKLLQQITALGEAAEAAGETVGELTEAVRTVDPTIQRAQGFLEIIQAVDNITSQRRPTTLAQEFRTRSGIVSRGIGTFNALGPDYGPEELAQLIGVITDNFGALITRLQGMRDATVQAARAVEQLTSQQAKARGGILNQAFEASLRYMTPADARAARVSNLQSRRSSLAARLQAGGGTPEITLALIGESQQVLQELLGLQATDASLTLEEAKASRDEIVGELEALASLSDHTFQIQIDKQQEIIDTNQDMLDELGIGGSFVEAITNLQDLEGGLLKSIRDKAATSFDEEIVLLRDILEDTSVVDELVTMKSTLDGMNSDRMANTTDITAAIREERPQLAQLNILLQSLPSTLSSMITSAAGGGGGAGGLSFQGPGGVPAHTIWPRPAPPNTFNQRFNSPLERIAGSNFNPEMNLRATGFDETAFLTASSRPDSALIAALASFAVAGNPLPTFATPALAQAALGAIRGFGTLTGFAHGGIVTSPTLALIGEAGPEAVVPLGGMGGGGTNITVNGVIKTAVNLDGQRMAEGLAPFTIEIIHEATRNGEPVVHVRGLDED